jgi:glycosyltransferase involved in cell wall biosynthesis
MSENALIQKRVTIASYTHVMRGEFTKLGGPALALKDFLKTRAASLTCIWQPLPISDNLDAIAEIYEQGNFRRQRFWIPNWPWGKEGDVTLLYLLLKLRDIFAMLYFVLWFRKKSDYFIGVEALNALLGILFRRVGLVTKVIYYNLDYGEIRFKNIILNSVFHALDRLAAQHSDCIWNLSPEMAKARETRLGAALSTPQITVPIGTDFERIKRLPIEKVEKNTIVYLGVLAEKCGVHLILDAFPEMVRRHPPTKFVVIGGGPLEDDLRARAAETGLADRIEFMGRISDDGVERTLSKCAVGIAPYLADPDSTKRFTDVTKPRMYLTCGLPVIITGVPPVAKEIAEHRAGIVINYDKSELADAVIRILTDDELFKEFRQNAVRLASKYGWVDIFSHAFSETMRTVEKPATGKHG